MTAAQETASRHRLIMVGLILAIIGVGLSLYATKHFLAVTTFGHTDAACNINQVFSCDTVALSKYAAPLGVPLGVWGAAYFAALAVLLVFARVRDKAEDLQAYAAMVVIGLVTSLVLGTISWTQIAALCVVCLGVYAVTLLQAGVTGLFRLTIPRPFSLAGLVSGGSTGVIVVALVIAGFNVLRPSLNKATAAGDVASSAKIDSHISAATNPITANLAAPTLDVPLDKTPYSGLGEDYHKGGDSAKVVIVEFADFECPACKVMAGVLTNLEKQFGDRLEIFYKTYPLSSQCNPSMHSNMHPFACEEAELARCSGQYGKFWQYHDEAYAAQDSISEQKAKDIAKALGLTDDQIKACLQSTDVLAKIKADVAEGDKLGVDATPSLFINGHRYVGDRSEAAMASTIEALLHS